MKIGLIINKKLKEQLQAIAEDEDRSMSSVARIAIEKGLPFFGKGGIHHPPKKTTRVESTLTER
tara:strand:+ start:7527 stop:7718 length:192 start_codon:yes stop_codon:yes gene_type:complete